MLYGTTDSVYLVTKKRPGHDRMRSFCVRSGRPSCAK